MPLVAVPITPPRLNDGLSFNLGLSVSLGLNLGNCLVVRDGLGRGTGVAGRGMACHGGCYCYCHGCDLNCCYCAARRR